MPKLDTISFGRLDKLADGTPANEIVLDHPDGRIRRAISRWHFELRRPPSGYCLRQLSDGMTHVDGEKITTGEEVLVKPATVVRVSSGLTLRFSSPPASHIAQAATTVHFDTEL